MANMSELNLDIAGIKTTRSGIMVDNFLKTTNPQVLAMGDVTGQAMFAHAAKRESQIIINNIINQKKETADFERMPWAVFTNPPVAGIGLSEYQASGHKIDYEVLKTSFEHVGRATIEGETHGFMKILFDKKTRHIIGATIIGPHADDLIHEIVAVMNCKEPSIDVILRSIHTHPTLSEVMSELRHADPLKITPPSNVPQTTTETKTSNKKAPSAKHKKSTAQKTAKKKAGKTSAKRKRR